MVPLFRCSIDVSIRFKDDAVPSQFTLERGIRWIHHHHDVVGAGKDRVGGREPQDIGYGCGEAPWCCGPSYRKTDQAGLIYQESFLGRSENFVQGWVEVGKRLRKRIRRAKEKLAGSRRDEHWINFT